MSTAIMISNIHFVKTAIGGLEIDLEKRSRYDDRQRLREELIQILTPEEVQILTDFLNGKT